MANEMKDIIAKIDSSWNKDYIIRYLYVFLAPYFKRDVKYFLASEEEQIKQYNQGFINRGSSIVCSTLVDFYINLFADFNIKAYKIRATNSKVPLFAMMVEGLHGYYYLDPLSDLFNNQYGLKSMYFACTPNKHIKYDYPDLIDLSNDIVACIDKKINVPEPRNEYFEMLHHKFLSEHKIESFLGIHSKGEDSLINKRMEFINESLINMGNVNGPIERKMLYNYLRRMLFNKVEKRRINIRLSMQNYVPIVEVNNNSKESTLYIETKEDGIYTLKKVR